MCSAASCDSRPNGSIGDIGGSPAIGRQRDDRGISAAGHRFRIDDRTVGLVLRALRRRRGWRQIDLARRAGCSQPFVSMIERGHAGSSTVDTVRRLFGVLEARLELTPRWRGAELDRLLDEAHARIVAAAAARLEALGWQVVLEVTYSEFGERGSIDVLGLKPEPLAAVVVEVKSDIAAAEAVGRKLDEKTRLAPKIIRARFGWTPGVVATVLVMPDTDRLRRLFSAASVLSRMFPTTSRDVVAWLREPAGRLVGRWFLSNISGRNRRVVRPPGRAGSQLRRSAR